MMTLGAMMAAALAVAVRADEGVSSFFDLTAIDIRCARSLVPALAGYWCSVQLGTDRGTRVSGGG